MERPTHLVVGRIGRPHGVRGEVVLDPVTDAPDAIFASGRSFFVGDRDGRLLALAPLEIVAIRPFQSGFLVKVGGIGDRDTAAMWRGRTLLANVDDIPPPDEDEVYYHHILGMRVHNAAGEDVGPVVEMYDLPAALTIEVETARGLKLVPYIPEIVESVDEEARIIRLRPLDGLLD
jgi:16S rRNA processing protein RimM